MTNILEFNRRASLCRQLAVLEPESRCFWLAEAERWLRLTRENRNDPAPKPVTPQSPKNSLHFD
jgi:hypothetical protein